MRLFIIFYLFLNTSNTDVVIQWHESVSLSWTDFRGSVESNTDAVAVTASGITFSFSVKELNDEYVSFEVKANAHFYPDKSWYNKEKGNDHILAHEQLHFDITELHVRKLRYEVSKLEISQNIKIELRHLHDAINFDLAQMQHAYDSQTENSINYEQQLLWSEHIKKELKKYRTFRSQ